MIIGATKETDYEIVHMAQALYQQFDLKRVFYSAFVNTTGDSLLPDTKERGPELLREHRLYQADFLMRFYQFRADEIITKENPNLNVSVDPKCNWALYHLDSFPVEVEKADYHTLLRVPGNGHGRTAGYARVPAGCGVELLGSVASESSERGEITGRGGTV